VPGYMIPGVIMQLEAMPLNSNGKVDKTKLPEPDAATGQERTIVLPRNPLEDALLQVWKEVLGGQAFGVTDDFFQLGGHSLKATRLRSLVAGQLKKALSLNEIFAYPTIEAQASLLREKAASILPAIPKAESSEAYPISLSQERLWVLTQFAEASKAYYMPAAFKVAGRLDKGLLGMAFQRVIEKFEILRTGFIQRGGQPMQVVRRAEEGNFHIREISLQADESIEEVLKKEWERPFDLENGSLLDCLLVTGETDRYLSFSMHHIISDGWSLVVLYKNMMTAYRDLVGGGSGRLQQPGIQYKDFASWQRGLLAEGGMHQQQQFWLEQFADGLPVLNLPTDYHRPAVKSYSGSVMHTMLGMHCLTGLNRLAADEGLSIFMLLHTAVALLLGKYAGQHDLVIGTPVSGRDHPQLEDQIGFFVNTLPIRIRLNEDETVRSLLQRQKKLLLEAFDNLAFPFETLVDSLPLKKDLSRSPLFDVMVVLQNMDGLQSEDMTNLIPGAKLHRMEFDPGIAKYDLSFTFAERSDGLTLALEYNTKLFKPVTVGKVAKRLEQLLMQLAAFPGMQLSELEWVDAGERAIILEEYNRPVGVVEDRSLPGLLAGPMRMYADRTAVEFGERSLSYREINEAAERLSERLRRRSGEEGSRRLVGVLMERNEWTIACLLGIWKAGAGYVPVDPGYPASRISYMLLDAGVGVLLTDEACVSLVPADYAGEVMLWNDEVQDDRVVLYDSGRDCREDTAYVIYTSGSTGKPKGVEICHRNTLAFLRWAQEEFKETPFSILYACTSYCFDLSVYEFFFPLLMGRTIRMLRSGLEIGEYLGRESGVLLNTVPSVVKGLLSEKVDLSRVVGINMAGEALPRRLKEQLEAIGGMELRNLYGPTEDTTYSTVYRFEWEDHGVVPIGRSVGYTQLYILDEWNRLLPEGMEGEICLSGEGVAKGYLGRPELTAEKFVANPFVTGLRMYRTGDMGRWLPDGQVEYRGRKDQQVKLRGHRIELEEIEYQLGKVEGIKEAVVRIWGVGEEVQLVGYWVGEKIEVTEIKKQLTDGVPGYMIPGVIMQLEAMPLNSNGKVDKTKLPEPVAMIAQTVFVPGRNETDHRIAEIWMEVLGREGIGIRDNFFDLGGHSLKAVRIIAKMQEVFKVKIDLKDLFAEPTIEHLSNYVDAILWMNSGETVSEGEGELIF